MKFFIIILYNESEDYVRMILSRLRVRVPTRAATKKKEARGIYPNAEVVPGRDWIETEQTIGAIIIILCFSL